MIIVVTARKPIYVPNGRLPAGIPIDVAPALAQFLIRKGEAVAFETKQTTDSFFQAAGVSQFALPAVQASQSQTATSLDSGDTVPKRRGRPPKKL